MLDSVYLPLPPLWLETSPRKGLSPKKRDLKVVSKLWVLGVLGGCVCLCRVALRVLDDPARRELLLLLRASRCGQEVVGWVGVLPEKDLVRAAVVRAMGPLRAAPPPPSFTAACLPARCAVSFGNSGWTWGEVMPGAAPAGSKVANPLNSVPGRAMPWAGWAAGGVMPSSERVVWAWGGGTDVLRRSEEEEAPAWQSWGDSRSRGGHWRGGFLASPVPSSPCVFLSLGAEGAPAPTASLPIAPRGWAPHGSSALGGAGWGLYRAAEGVLQETFFPGQG